jgi:hypothetical protein
MIIYYINDFNYLKMKFFQFILIIPINFNDIIFIKKII